MAKALHSIFVSYVLRDQASGNQIVSSIRRHRPDVRVFNHFDLSVVEPWVAKVREWIAKCDVFIVLLTPNSVDSENVLTEIGAAWGLGKPIVKVLPRGYVGGAELPISLYDQPTIWLEDIYSSDVLEKTLDRYLARERTVRPAEAVAP